MPISVRPSRSVSPTSATATSYLRKAATIGRTYERLIFNDRESPGSNRSKTAVPVYTMAKITFAARPSANEYPTLCQACGR